MSNKNNIEIEMMLTCATIGNRLVENLINDNNYKREAKQFWNGLKTRFENLVNNIKSSTDFQMSKEIEKKITDNYDNGSFANIVYYYGMMNDEQRNQLEKECEKIMNF